MLCEMPVLNLPSDLASSNDTRRDGLAVSTLRTANEIANLYIGYLLDDLPTFKNISKSRPHISFSLSQLEVSFPPPPDEPFSFDPSISKYINIKVCVHNTTHYITLSYGRPSSLHREPKTIVFCPVFCFFHSFPRHFIHCYEHSCDIRTF